MGRSKRRLAGLIAWSCLIAEIGCGLTFSRSTLPSTLSDQEFWRLTSELSEPPCEFTHSENLVSNEIHFVHTIRRLRGRGGVYIGVGPEQNFTYVAVLQSKLAFVVDIRRQNMVELLMYKALFDMSPNRADFVSNLFSRVRPAGLDTKTTSAPAVGSD